jgi:hypothetical protein
VHAVRRPPVISAGSTHSAAGQAAGYQYQTEQALLRFVQQRQSRLTLFVERFDDFDIEGEAKALDVIEAKHQISPGDLTDTSVDLWRTINVWITILESLEADEIPSFLLLTTASATPDGVASLLRDMPNKDPDLALTRLMAVAESATGATTETWRGRFLKLPEDRRKALVSAITVADQQPQLADIREALKSEFAPTVRAEHLDAFVERLTGWWFGRVARMLTGRLQGVAIEDLWSYLQQLRDGFNLDNLPFEYEVPEPTDEEGATYAAATFTKQLRIVDVAEDRIAFAIRDYHRAYSNTSRWMREGLLLPGELTGYESRIVDEWRRHYERMRQDIGDEATEISMREAGRRLWATLDTDIRMPTLRPLLDEPTISRGTLHTLADDQRIGWHPVFRERLRELLEELVA